MGTSLRIKPVGDMLVRGSFATTSLWPCFAVRTHAYRSPHQLCYMFALLMNSTGNSVLQLLALGWGWPDEIEDSDSDEEEDVLSLA